MRTVTETFRRYSPRLLKHLWGMLLLILLFPIGPVKPVLGLEAYPGVRPARGHRHPAVSPALAQAWDSRAQTPGVLTPLFQRATTQAGTPFPIGAPQPSSAWAPSVASDGLNYLVLWEDYRDGERDIYGTRVTPSGQLLEIGGIAVSTASGSQCSTDVAFDGANYLAVWEDHRNGTSDIYGARITPAGQVLDPNGIAISPGDGRASRPAVAFDGTNYFIVWEDRRLGFSCIHGARVTPAGRVLEPDGISLATGQGEQFTPDLEFDGTNYLVVWNDWRSPLHRIYGARVTRSGVVLDQQGIRIAYSGGKQWRPSIAFDGTNYLVVWVEYVSGAFDIYGTRVTPGGTVLDFITIKITTGWMATLEGGGPAVAFDGANYLVVWQDRRRIDTRWGTVYCARVSISGDVLDPEGTKVADYWRVIEGSDPNVATNGADYIVVWRDEQRGFSEIYGGRVNLDASLPDDHRFGISSPPAEEQLNPSVASGGSYLVVWEDYRSDFGSIFGTRVSSSGIVSDPYGFPVSEGGTSDRMYPAAASDGTDYLVVWEDYRDGTSDIYASRMTASGSVLDPEGIVISSSSGCEYSPAVAFGDGEYLVVWSEERQGTASICGARVSMAGEVLDTDGIPISLGSFGKRWPGVVFNGTDYVVVWSDGRNGSWDIYGCRVSPDGSVFESDGIPISIATGEQCSPAIACDGTNCMVVWEDSREESWDIYAARVKGNGQVFDPEGIPVSTSTGYQFSPDIVFDGANYVVVWSDQRAGASDIYGARVNPQGSVGDPAGIPIHTGVDWQISPSIRRGQGCAALIGYVYFIPPGRPGGSVVWGNFWGGPTGLTFSSVLAEGAGGCANISWEVASEVPVSSFVIMRSKSEDGIFLRLDAPISRGPESSFSFTDCAVLAGHTYWYKVGLASPFGEEWYGPIPVYIESVPAKFLVHQSYPNPFNPICSIRFELPESERVVLRIFDVSGSAVRTLVDARMGPGVFTETWDGTAGDGSQLPSGLYFYRLEAGDFVASSKMVLLR